MAEDKDTSKSTKAAPKAGFKADGSPYPGVDPDTGERKAVTYEGLVSEFGKARGEQIYFAISDLGRHGITPQNQTDTYPSLSLNGLKKEDVDAIFAKVKE